VKSKPPANGDGAIKAPSTPERAKAGMRIKPGPGRPSPSSSVPQPPASDRQPSDTGAMAAGEAMTAVAKRPKVRKAPPPADEHAQSTSEKPKPVKRRIAGPPVESDGPGRPASSATNVSASLLTAHQSQGAKQPPAGQPDEANVSFAAMAGPGPSVQSSHASAANIGPDSTASAVGVPTAPMPSEPDAQPTAASQPESASSTDAAATAAPASGATAHQSEAADATTEAVPLAVTKHQRRVRWADHHQQPLTILTLIPRENSEGQEIHGCVCGDVDSLPWRTAHPRFIAAVPCMSGDVC
jgi:hypothetical protein